MPRKPKATDKKSAQDYEQLGRLIEASYLSGFIDRKLMLKNSFLKGLAGGLGGVIGATIIVALVLWLLSLLETAPFVGPIFDNLQNTIDSRK